MRAAADGPLRVVILYAEVVGYVVGMLKALTRCDPSAEIDVVFFDRKHVNSTRFAVPDLSRVTFHPRSALTDDRLLDLLHSRRPDIVYVSGWMDDGYLRAVRRYRAAGGAGRVVCGLDDQWKGTLRQHLGQLYFRLRYASLFDFMWVSGKPQYQFAQRLGYGHERIIGNLYSADTDAFSAPAAVAKRFVFVGRFDPVKGLDDLIEGYVSLPDEVQRSWPLVLIGDGELRAFVEARQNGNVTIMPFLQPDALAQELMRGGVGCLPSHSEQWGVAIQEMALLGYPLVLSSACGAATEFLITGYNGFLFRRSDRGSLRSALLRIASLSDEELRLFSRRSHALGRRIVPEHAAASLLSVIPLSAI